MVVARSIKAPDLDKYRRTPRVASISTDGLLSHLDIPDDVAARKVAMSAGHEMSDLTYRKPLPLPYASPATSTLGTMHVEAWCRYILRGPASVRLMHTYSVHFACSCSSSTSLTVHSHRSLCPDLS